MSSQPQPVILQFDIDDKGSVKVTNINRGLDQMGKQATVAGAKLKAFDMRAMAMKATLAGLGSLAAGSAAGVALMARRMNELDATMKSAAAVGMTARQLTTLQYSMSLSGVQAERLTDGINKLNMAVGRAAEGNAEINAAFVALGLSFEHLAGMSTDERMMAVADALSRVNDSARRASIAARIFGDGQRQLVSALAQGSAAINAQRAEAERLGAAISDVYAKRLQEFNDSQERIKVSTKSLIDVFANEFAPVMTRINNDIAEMITGQATWAQGIAGTGVKVEAGYNVLQRIARQSRRLLGDSMALSNDIDSIMGRRNTIIGSYAEEEQNVKAARESELETIRKQAEETQRLAQLERERAAMARAHAAEGEAMVKGLLAEADALEKQRDEMRKREEDAARYLADLESQTAELNRQADVLARNLRMQQGGIAAGNVPGPLGGNVGGVYGTFEEFGAQREMLVELETMQAESIARQIELQEMGSAEAIRIAEANAARQIEINRARNAAILGLTAGLAGETAATMENYARATGKKSREMALAQKGLAIGQATINTYLAASAAMASSAVLGPVAAAAAAKIITALGLANVALIAATPLETYHDGGLVTGPGGGQFGGRRLRADEVPAVLQTGEVVLSRADVAMLSGKSGGAAGQPAAPSAGPTVQAVILREEDLENWAMSRRGRRAINMAVER
jgi:hypothetical protein